MTILIFILIAGLLFISGLAKGIRDDEVRTENVGVTDDNKYYKNPQGNNVPLTSSPWWYLGLYTPKYQEKFIYSSTILVLFTDKYHWFSFVENMSLFIAIGLGLYGFTIKALWVIFACYIIKQIAFNLKYEKIL